MSSKSPFAHLHLHSEHSPLDGACRMDQLMARVKELGMEEVALTDHGTMSGLLKFQKAAAAASVKPILGCELYFTEDRKVKDPNNRYYHLTALAETTKGYENLCKMNSLANREGFYYKPRSDYELLKKYGEGIIILTGCMASRTMQKLMDKDIAEARQEVVNMMECVGEENVYLEVQNVGIDGQVEWNAQLNTIAKDLKRPIVGTGDVHYLREEDADPHDAMLCVQMKTTLDVPVGYGPGMRMGLLPNKYHLRSPQEMAASLEAHPDSLAITHEIAKRCDAYIETDRTFDLLPQFSVPEEFVSDKSQPEKPERRDVSDEAWAKEWRAHCFYREKVFQGLHERYGDPLPGEVRERAEFELKTTLNMGVTDYFLIVWDLIREAHERNIPTGPGRGCLVAGSPIWTPTGWAAIKDIRTGDTIMTHEGQESTVRKTFQYEVDEPIYTIRHYFDDGVGLRLTGNHRVLVEPSRTRNGWTGTIGEKVGRWEVPNGDLQWRRADDIKPGDLVVVPRPKIQEQPAPRWDLAELVTEEEKASGSVEIHNDYLIEKRRTNKPFIGSLHSMARSSPLFRPSWKRLRDGTAGPCIQRRALPYIQQQGFTGIEDWRAHVLANTFTEERVPRFIEANEDYCRLLGLLASDGWLCSREGQYGIAEHGENRHSDPSVQELWQLVWPDTFSLTEHRHTVKRLIQYEGHSRLIARHYRGIFSEYQQTPQSKHLPRWCFGLSYSHRKAIIEGLWMGDGHTSQRTGDKTCFDTISPALAHGVRTLLWSLGIHNGCKKTHRPSLQPGFKNTQPAYKITASKGWGDHVPAQFGAVDEEYHYMRVTSVTKERQKTRVYDFAVKDEASSFLTSSCAVHNSGAGSIMLYALSVTQLDPLEHGLLFERFLNPDRISMPDIDLDFSPDRRKELMDYMREKYGAENVAQIMTFGRIGSKAGIRRAAQAMGREYLGLADKLAKTIPTKGTVAAPLKVAMEESPEFKQILNSNRDAQRIVKLATWMEGMIQNEGVHAAALIVAPKPVDEIVPVQASKDGTPLSAFDMKDAEGVGLLKLDFLGLRNLDVIAESERLIKRHRDIELDAWKIPLDDAPTYEMMARGDSIGVFQFECLAGDTIINGEAKKTIQELYEEQPAHLLSLDLANGVRRKNNVLKVVKRGKKQLYKIITSDGYLLRATREHKILTSSGWKQVKDLNVDDEIAVNSKDASRIGGCTQCRRQTRSRSGMCTSCRNIERESGQVMVRNRNHEKWLENIARGDKQPFFGGLVNSPQLVVDSLPHKVRSHWEADFCKALIALDIEYRYEPKSFILNDGSSYTPDVYLPYFDAWIEIKGRARCPSGRSKARIDKFKQAYPECNLQVVGAHEIANFELDNPTLVNWGCPALPKHFAFDAVLSITEDQVEETYDICMQAPFNNYIANGMVVHNSSGMQDSLRTVGADQFNDLVAIVALYRPGPMANIPVYGRRKQGKEVTKYLDPKLESIQGETWGLTIYQEQSMLISRELAGFTPGEADTLRKAIGKKLMDVMMALKPKFISGCKENGVSEKVALQLWADNEAAADYSFNKCLHSQTRVILPNGKRLRLSEAYNQQVTEVMSMWPDGEIRPHKVAKIVPTGRKPLYQIKTESGRQIRATLEHRLLSTCGYKEVRDLEVGNELITTPPYDKQECLRRSQRMKAFCQTEARKKMDKRASKRMIAYQANRNPEEKIAHMKAMHKQYPHLTKAGTEAMHKKIKWLLENDKEWVRNHTQKSIASSRATYNTGPGFGHCSIASNGMWCASNPERAMCEYLCEQGIEFEIHKVLDNGRICDFYFAGIYWEMDGMDRAHRYFEDKYGDLPFVVVTPEDYKLVIEKHLQLEHAENGDPIVSIEYWKEDPTYDIEMERSGPLNFVANGIISHNSHAAAYALVSYVTAYLKANYPTEYMAALLSSVMSTKDKVPFYLYETKKMGIKVLSPDVNASFSDFEPEGDGNVRFGLTAIKGVGTHIVEEIAGERDRGGRYKNLWDFAQRVESANRRELEALVKAGAFDSTGETRKGLLAVVESALKQAKNIRKKKSEGQDSLFDAFGGSAEDEFAALELMDTPTVGKEEFTEMERFELEREVAGIYVSGHPLDHAQAAWEQVRHAGLGQITAEHIDRTITVAGIVTAKRIIFTKRDNKKMLIVTLEDLTGSSEIVVFPKTLEAQDCERLVEPGCLAAIRVKVEEDDRGFGAPPDSEDGEPAEKQTRMSLVMAFPFDPKAVDVPDYYDITVARERLSKEFMEKLKTTLNQFPGGKSVRLRIMNEGAVIKNALIPDIKVEPSEQLTHMVEGLAGKSQLDTIEE